jgi:hypothetical protein
MGIVYKDEDISLDRFVAHKSLPDDIAQHHQARWSVPTRSPGSICTESSERVVPFMRLAKKMGRLS